MTRYLASVTGFDPDRIPRFYASTWIEARQEAINYTRNRSGTAPLKRMALRCENSPANVMEAASAMR
jgi:hypothetical protein